MRDQTNVSRRRRSALPAGVSRAARRHRRRPLRRRRAPPADARAGRGARRVACHGPAGVRAARGRGLRRRASWLRDVRAGADLRRAGAAARRAQGRRPRPGALATALLARRRLPLESAYASARAPLRWDFRYGMPSLADFPLATWHRCLGRAARRAPRRAYDYGPPQGSAPLRAALAGYLGRSRGVGCTPDQIVVVTGSQQGIDLAARLLLAPGDRGRRRGAGLRGRAQRVPRRTAPPSRRSPSTTRASTPARSPLRGWRWSLPHISIPSAASCPGRGARRCSAGPAAPAPG